MYAVIETGGKQYKVQEGDVIFIEKLNADEEVKFDKIIAISDEGKLTCGSPYVEGAVVEGKVVGQGKGKKIVVFKFKAKKGYKRTQGHRQPYTKVQIEKIAVEA